MKKFELVLNDTKVFLGVTVYRIRACVEISCLGVKVGDLGGYVEKENNLDITGNAWVYGNAWVSGNARVSGNAWVYGKFQLLNIIGLRWSITLDKTHIGIGCKRKRLKEWNEQDAKEQGLSQELYCGYRKLIIQMRKVQRMERELIGDVPKLRAKK
jgi:hypothetical protein